MTTRGVRVASAEQRYPSSSPMQDMSNRSPTPCNPQDRRAASGRQSRRSEREPRRSSSPTTVIFQSSGGPAVSPERVLRPRDSLVPLIEGGQSSPLVPNASAAAWGATSATERTWGRLSDRYSTGRLRCIRHRAGDGHSDADRRHARGTSRERDGTRHQPGLDQLHHLHPPCGAQVIPHNLTATLAASAYRYRQAAARDFVALFARRCEALCRGNPVSMCLSPVAAPTGLCTVDHRPIR
jgi:hypothetical protein